MKKLSLLIIFILTSYQFTFPQSPPFKQFKTGDGLPSPNIYDCMRDKDGYMWFSTDNGISRFDYYSFRNFSKKDGLNSNFILNMIEKENELFIGNKSDGINVYSNNIISNLNYAENPRRWISKLVLHKSKIYKFTHNDITLIEGDSTISVYEYLPNKNSHNQFVKGTYLKIYWIYSFNDEKIADRDFRRSL